MLLKRKTYNILKTRCQYLNRIYKHAITTIVCIIKRYNTRKTYKTRYKTQLLI
jgi:sRNA-binding regulator protein Hfq